MQEAKEILTREYIKRVLMDMIDRQAFLNLVAPYRVGTAVNFEQMKEAGVVDTYNLFAYLTTASSLKKTVLESMIADYSSDSSKKEELKSKQEKQQKRLEKLQEKIGFTPQNGGLIDELEEANGLSNIMIGEEAINTTNKTLEEQITIYQEQLKNPILSYTDFFKYNVGCAGCQPFSNFPFGDFHILCGFFMVSPSMKIKSA